jgi:hypothetical protein
MRRVRVTKYTLFHNNKESKSIRNNEARDRTAEKPWRKIKVTQREAGSSSQHQP